MEAGIMRHWSIVTKIAVSACGVVSVLLILAGVVLINFERNLIAMFKEEHFARIRQSIDNREEAEKVSLQKNVAFNAHILGEISAAHLYNVDPEAIKRPLQSYMNYPEILAIKVVDENGNPFAAVWRNPDVVADDTLPDNLPVDERLSVQLDAMYDQAKVGSVRVYYTDSDITEKIERIKEETLAETEAFHTILRTRLNRAIISQSIGILLIIFALISCLLVLLRILVIKPVRMVSTIAHKLMDFDLTVSVDTDKKDEIGHLLTAINEMVGSFRKVIGQVQRSGIQVTSSATELSATAKQQEATMRIQVESTNKVVQSTQEISDVATNLVDTMQRVALMSQETAEYATRGQADLLRMEEAMHQMEEASKSISGRLETINEKAENITTVVTTITKVADQTNLLSLNAAIEAEKAGEYGRGFTVVAREIRRLADQTAVATLDIERMVQEMQSAVASGVMEMDKFIKDVQQSADDVGKISMQLALIIEQVQTLSPSFEDVTEAMQSQSGNAQQINNAMVKLSEEMQQTEDSLHETYSAIGQLDEAARDLRDEVSQFKL